MSKLVPLISKIVFQNKQKLTKEVLLSSSGNQLLKVRRKVVLMTLQC